MTDVMTLQPVADIVKQTERAIREISGVTVKLMPVTCYHSSFKNIEGITDLICAALEVDPAKVRAYGRKKEVVTARHLVCWHAVMYTNLSLKSIGEYLSGRDHTTMIHSRDEINKFLGNNDSIILDAMDKISNEITRRNEIHTRREGVPA